MFDGKFCLLIVDDEVRMTKGLKDFFCAKGFSVLVANNGEEALEVYYDNNEKIDAILLDIMMPIRNGIEVLKELREQEEYVPVLMLTAKSEEYDEIEGLSCGADDYIAKPFSTAILLARVQNIIGRFCDIENGKSVCGLTLKASNYTLENDEKKTELTPKEFDLLSYLIKNKNIVLSREKILNSVWGYSYEGDERTVDTHIKQLRMKLCDKSGLIKTVHRVGYVFEVG